jgi:hypothetical protein
METMRRGEVYFQSLVSDLGEESRPWVDSPLRHPPPPGLEAWYKLDTRLRTPELLTLVQEVLDRAPIL